MSDEVAVVTGAGRDRFVPALFAVVLVSAALYFARIVFEPIAFVLFAMALVWPFQKAIEIRMGKPIELTLTILLTLLVISIGEPVSDSKFPVSREFAGNFSEFEPDRAKGVWLMR